VLAKRITKNYVALVLIGSLVARLGLYPHGRGRNLSLGPIA
jgi:hypothetical protein